ncbi:latent-transforming growth factor beta-binding protein 1-like [Danio aesculapii]|uniref:latent-transforming growth factor beta-binding protein 1-like n=1 Tax=Danio aesculapii TaxID=1142201 RepID=UPI0024C0B7A0|nr:latent-transforming growth factor beta-binding protein 1-like [Danio aesculapii]
MSGLWRLSFCVSGSLFITFLSLAMSSSSSVSHQKPQIRHPLIYPPQNRSKTHRYRNHSRTHIDLKGPNVCGSRCCHSWLVNPKTKQCTKPRCHPRCHNRAVCGRLNVCQCRPGFHGHRCEHVNVTETLSSWSETNTSAPETHSSAPAAVASTTVTPDLSTSANTDARKTYSLHWQPPRLKESQSVLLKRALSSGTAGQKITNVILKYIESERRKLETSSSTGVTAVSSNKTFHSQRGQYKLIYSAECDVFQ